MSTTNDRERWAREKGLWITPPPGFFEENAELRGRHWRDACIGGRAQSLIDTWLQGKTNHEREVGETHRTYWELFGEER